MPPDIDPRLDPLSCDSVTHGWSGWLLLANGRWLRVASGLDVGQVGAALRRHAKARRVPPERCWLLRSWESPLGRFRGEGSR